MDGAICLTSGFMWDGYYWTTHDLQCELRDSSSWWDGPQGNYRSSRLTQLEAYVLPLYAVLTLSGNLFETAGNFAIQEEDRGGESWYLGVICVCGWRL